MSHQLQVCSNSSIIRNFKLSSSSEYEKENTIIISSEHSLSNDTMKRICWQDPVVTTSMMKQCDEKKEVCDEKPENSDCTYDKKKRFLKNPEIRKEMLRSVQEQKVINQSNQMNQKEICQIMKL